MSEIEKICFVVSPIGNDGSPTRDRADKVLKYLIRPPLKEAGYHVIRADEIARPGMISTDMFNHLINDDLVIADLSEHNPNVFYELAVRHATNKPCIAIISQHEKIPFDVQDMRVIRFDHKDFDSVDQAKASIKELIQAIEASDGSTAFFNPIGYALLQMDRFASDSSVEIDIAQILKIQRIMQQDMSEIKNQYFIDNWDSIKQTRLLYLEREIIDIKNEMPVYEINLDMFADKDKDGFYYFEYDGDLPVETEEEVISDYNELLTKLRALESEYRSLVGPHS